MAMVGRLVHLTTFFFLSMLEIAVNQYFVHILSLVTDNNPSLMIQQKLFHDQSPQKDGTGPGSNLQLP